VANEFSKNQFGWDEKKSISILMLFLDIVNKVYRRKAGLYYFYQQELFE